MSHICDYASPRSSAEIILTPSGEKFAQQPPPHQDHYDDVYYYYGNYYQSDDDDDKVIVQEQEPLYYPTRRPTSYNNNNGNGEDDDDDVDSTAVPPSAPSRRRYDEGGAGGPEGSGSGVSDGKQGIGNSSYNSYAGGGGGGGGGGVGVGGCGSAFQPIPTSTQQDGYYYNENYTYLSHMKREKSSPAPSLMEATLSPDSSIHSTRSASLRSRSARTSTSRSNPASTSSTSWHTARQHHEEEEESSRTTGGSRGVGGGGGSRGRGARGRGRRTAAAAATTPATATSVPPPPPRGASAPTATSFKWQTSIGDYGPSGSGRNGGIGVGGLPPPRPSTAPEQQNYHQLQHYHQFPSTTMSPVSSYDDDSCYYGYDGGDGGTSSLRTERTWDEMISLGDSQPKDNHSIVVRDDYHHPHHEYHRTTTKNSCRDDSYGGDGGGDNLKNAATVAGGGSGGVDEVWKQNQQQQTTPYPPPPQQLQPTVVAAAAAAMAPNPPVPTMATQTESSPTMMNVSVPCTTKGCEFYGSIETNLLCSQCLMKALLQQVAEEDKVKDRKKKYSDTPINYDVDGPQVYYDDDTSYHSRRHHAASTTTSDRDYNYDNDSYNEIMYYAYGSGAGSGFGTIPRTPAAMMSSSHVPEADEPAKKKKNRKKTKKSQLKQPPPSSTTKESEFVNELSIDNGQPALQKEQEIQGKNRGSAKDDGDEDDGDDGYDDDLYSQNLRHWNDDGLITECSSNWDGYSTHSAVVQEAKERSEELEARRQSQLLQQQQHPKQAAGEIQQHQQNQDLMGDDDDHHSTFTSAWGSEAGDDASNAVAAAAASAAASDASYQGDFKYEKEEEKEEIAYDGYGIVDDFQVANERLMMEQYYHQQECLPQDEYVMDQGDDESYSNYFQNENIPHVSSQEPAGSHSNDLLMAEYQRLVTGYEDGQSHLDAAIMAAMGGCSISGANDDAGNGGGAPQLRRRDSDVSTVVNGCHGGRGCFLGAKRRITKAIQKAIGGKQ